jgi:hypothetical protein
MNCSGCGNESAYAVRAVYKDGRIQESCNHCGGLTSVANVPDVYFKQPYWDQHLGSQDDPGPKFIGSKSEKAYWLKRNGLREAGDRIRGVDSFQAGYSREAFKNLNKRRPI